MTKGFRLALMTLAVVGLLAVALVVPWVYRNYAVLGRAKLQFGSGGADGVGDGVGLVRSYRLRAENGHYFRPERYKYLYGDHSQEAEAEFQAAQRRPVQDASESDLMFWLKRPGLFLQYCGVRFIGLIRPASWSATLCEQGRCD